MLTRRAFLEASSLVLAGTAVPEVEPSEALEQGQGRQELPPSIAALTPMRDGVQPITTDERRGRLERARRLMTEHGQDGLMLTGGTSLVYYANVRWGLSERLLALVVPVRGEPFVVCPAFEEDRAREQLAQGPLGPDGVAVLTWHEDESPYRLVAEGLAARGLATGRLGMEETVRFVFADGVAQAAPAATVVSGTPVTAGCRGRKDAHEVALMRHASAVTLKAYEAVYRALEDGMTQARVAELVAIAHTRLGYSGGAGVQVGEASALPHGSAVPQVIREGTVLLIDGGCAVEGYRSDISRTYVLGRPTDRMREVFAVVHRAQTAAHRAARPGVECQAVDAAARRVIDEAGFGPDYAHFTHRVGHGIGMDGHEWPYLVRGNTLPLAPGMAFSDEPGIYLPGEFGVRLEDDMVITETGAELLTPQSPSLEQPFDG
ncbi:MAG TPA: Xaa-Pro peptidase family protein [Gemmatimonadales bacterium]|jgi:Xaa-Pro dipeptidase